MSCRTSLAWASAPYTGTRPPTPPRLYPRPSLANLLPPSVLENSFRIALVNLRTDTSASVSGCARLSTVTRVADGVVHLRVRPFATNGFPIVSDGTAAGYTVFCTNALLPNTLTSYQAITQAVNHVNITCPERYDWCLFLSNAMPAYVELELGILEAQTYQRYKAIASANPPSAALFLSNHVAQVHIFRQRVPIHNVDPSAY